MGQESVDDSVIIAFKVSSVSWITLLWAPPTRRQDVKIALEVL
jgi:hypothetical protein